MEGEEGATKTREEIEGEISRAMRARVKDFKQQADSLTLEGVRRALEKDLGMKIFSLDAHKRFIKQCLNECFYGADDENESIPSGVESSQTIKEEKSRQSDNNQPPAEETKSKSDLDEEIKGSPASDRNELSDHETEDHQLSEHDTDLSEETIKEAIKRRSAYVKANLEHISLAKFRRTLEEDLKLEKKALDSYRSFISKEVDKLLQSPEVVKSSNGVKKKIVKATQDLEKSKPTKGSKRAQGELDFSDINDSVSEDEDVDEDSRPKKRAAQNITSSMTSLKRQKKSTDENFSTSNRKKPVKPQPEKSSADEVGNSSDDGHSHSSSEEEVKKKPEKPVQVYGKRVEHLKGIIKSCGMGVPPSIYRRAKQAPESKREAFLIKELEEILKKEGLSTNPSEKEIKAVKKRKETAKDLEGIDMSNIVTSSRRRTTSTYIPPPKPKIEVESDEDEEEEEEDEEDDDDDNEENTDDDGDDGYKVADSSEGSDEGAEDESD